MKILMIISEAPPVKSGISRVAEKLSQGLDDAGHEVDILSLDQIPRLELGEMRLSSMPFKLNGLKAEFKKYDLINLHGPVPTFSDIFLLIGLHGLGNDRPKLVYTHHAQVFFPNWWLRPPLWIYNFAHERLARLADHVIVTSPSYGHKLSRYVPVENLSVIPWGVDYAQYATPVYKNNPFTIMYLGQIRPYKGLPVLLKAVDKQANIRVWVVGNGHAAPQYQSLANKLAIDDITFWGHQPDEQVIDFMKKAHVIVLPSITKSEAFGIALLEGMAAGMVPVASHLPGVADLIGNEGYTFKPGDSRELREILVRLRDDNSLRTHLGILAQAKAKLYPWDRAVFGYDRIFRTLVGHTNPNLARIPGQLNPTLAITKETTGPIPTS